MVTVATNTSTHWTFSLFFSLLIVSMSHFLWRYRDKQELFASGHNITVVGFSPVLNHCMFFRGGREAGEIVSWVTCPS